MQEKEAFKIGFLARCQEQGLSTQQTVSLVKKASEALGKQALDSVMGAGVGAAGGLAKSLAPLVGGIALAAPPAAGALASYFYNKATDTDADAVDNVKNKELADSYRRMADKLRRAQALRQKKSEKSKSRQVFL